MYYLTKRKFMYGMQIWMDDPCCPGGIKLYKKVEDTPRYKSIFEHLDKTMLNGYISHKSGKLSEITKMIVFEFL